MLPGPRRSVRDVGAAARSIRRIPIPCSLRRYLNHVGFLTLGEVPTSLAPLRPQTKLFSSGTGRSHEQ